MNKEQLAGLTKKQRRYVESVESHTEGLTHVSTGVCGGCEQCRDTYGIKVPCQCGGEECWPEDNTFYCDDCDGKGQRDPTEEEFSEQVSNGSVCSEGSFSWQGCDICGSSLGSTMQVWHAIDANGELIHGEYACVDCVEYLANGDLPGHNDE